MMEEKPARARGTTADRETRRLLGHLRDLVLDTDLPHRTIEHRAGLSPGYLAQLFAGNVDLKMAHVLGVLDAIGLPAASFFRALHPVPSAVRGVDLPADEELASVYGFGIESLERLRERLEHFEDALGGLDMSDRQETP